MNRILKILSISFFLIGLTQGLEIDQKDDWVRYEKNGVTVKINEKFDGGTWVIAEWPNEHYCDFVYKDGSYISTTVIEKGNGNVKLLTMNEITKIEKINESTEKITFTYMNLGFEMFRNGQHFELIEFCKK